MGKWNKGPPQVSEQFLQNQQRRKQMIIEAAKRRKEKQKKLQQQVQIQKKNEQQALLRHKQQKKDAYVKYLRNNMHDKYEEMKRNQKLSQPEIRTKSKWKKDTLDSNSQMGSQIRHENNLQGLDLEVNIPVRSNRVTQNKIVNNKVGGQVVRNVPQAKTYYQKQQGNKWQNPSINPKPNTSNDRQKSPNKKQSQKRRLLQDQFEDMWKEQQEDHKQQKQFDYDCKEQKQFDYDLSVQQTVFDDMMGSKLLDSLDLDLDTVSRGKRWDKQLKQENKKNIQSKENREIDEIKNMIGYESVLMSTDQRGEMIKKYNQFMNNQVPQQIQSVNKAQPTTTKAFSKDQTKAFSKDKDNNNKSAKNSSKPNHKNDNGQKTTIKPLNQGQVFNELKNKKQGKILNWAQGQAQEADDLFSNCSTNKKSKTRGFQLLKQINKQIHEKSKKPPIVSHSSNTSIQQPNMKKKQKPLQTIPQKKINSSLQKLRQRSFDKKPVPNQVSATNVAIPNQGQNRSQQIRRSVSKEKVITQVNKPRVNRISSAQNRGQPPQPPKNTSKQRVNKTATNSFKEGNDLSGRGNNVTQPRSRVVEERRSLSRQKQGSRSEKEILQYKNDITPYNHVYSHNNPPLKVQQTTFPTRNMPPVAIPPTKKLPHLPANYRPSHDQITIATQDQLFQVQSFIKHELLSLNRQQRQLQQQLKNIHIKNKDKVKEVERKYEIKTDYRHSYEIGQRDGGQQGEDDRSVGSYQHVHKRQTEDQLQDSIQRLDDMLLRKEITNKEKNSRITQQDNQSQSTHRSLINPMTDPISLHKQVLQLASNLSRFQGQPEDPNIGYGAKLRMKNKSIQKQKNKSIEKQNKTQHKRPPSSKKKQTQIQLSQSQDVNFSELNSMQGGTELNSLQGGKSKVSKTSKVSKPPQLEYCQNQGSANIPAGYNESDLLDDNDDNQLEDSIQKGKIQVNQRLRRMLLE